MSTADLSLQGTLVWDPIQVAGGPQKSEPSACSLTEAVCPRTRHRVHAVKSILKISIAYLFLHCGMSMKMCVHVHKCVGALQVYVHPM